MGQLPFLRPGAHASIDPFVRPSLFWRCRRSNCSWWIFLPRGSCPSRTASRSVPIPPRHVCRFFSLGSVPMQAWLTLAPTAALPCFTASMAYSIWWMRPAGDHSVTSVSYWLRNMAQVRSLLQFASFSLDWTHSTRDQARAAALQRASSASRSKWIHRSVPTRTWPGGT